MDSHDPPPQGNLPGIRPPPPVVRLAEGLGLLLLIFGVAASRWGVALAGVVLIVGAYAVYRRRNPGLPPVRDDGSAGMGD